MNARPSPRGALEASWAMTGNPRDVGVRIWRAYGASPGLIDLGFARQGSGAPARPRVSADWSTLLVAAGHVSARAARGSQGRVHTLPLPRIAGARIDRGGGRPDRTRPALVAERDVTGRRSAPPRAQPAATQSLWRRATPGRRDDGGSDGPAPPTAPALQRSPAAEPGVVIATSVGHAPLSTMPAMLFVARPIQTFSGAPGPHVPVLMRGRRPALGREPAGRFSLSRARGAVRERGGHESSGQATAASSTAPRRLSEVAERGISDPFFQPGAQSVRTSGIAADVRAAGALQGPRLRVDMRRAPGIRGAAPLLQAPGAFRVSSWFSPIVSGRPASEAWPAEAERRAQTVPSGRTGADSAGPAGLVPRRAPVVAPSRRRSSSLAPLWPSGSSPLTGTAIEPAARTGHRVSRAERPFWPRIAGRWTADAVRRHVDPRTLPLAISRRDPNVGRAAISRALAADWMAGGQPAVNRAHDPVPLAPGVRGVTAAGRPVLGADSATEIGRSVQPPPASDQSGLAGSDRDADGRSAGTRARSGEGSLVDIDALAERVSRRLLRQLSIERERRGMSQWP